MIPVFICHKGDVFGIVEFGNLNFLNNFEFFKFDIVVCFKT